MPADFNLTPHPRILPMLGEINLAQWRCLAELVDNSVDGFLAALRGGASIDSAEILVNLPTSDAPSSRVTVRDNGPGMTPETLEQAVKAGWSGNNPIDSLGMFGMGFNIATARLGGVTTVWTSTAGEQVEHGLRIDFEELLRQRHFSTPHLTRPKADPAAHGTEVSVERLKPDQRTWLAKASNRSAVKRELSRAYSSMLRDGGVPLTFKLTLNGTKVSATQHCVWDDQRFVNNSRFDKVYAVMPIDRRLPDRPFCLACWQWLSATDQACPACGRPDDVIPRKRHVHGWIGLQRYLSDSSYGIDFIRNGRKIEISNRDLFYWRDPNSDAEELEYPIDDVRSRGRFVGEIHLDHCRVTYMKDRFDRTDPAWAEMVGIVRGEGPLQPQKASGLGFAGNDSPLFRLFQAFRRSSPPNAKVAGVWANVLVVRDNDRAEEMAKKFHEGDPEYQTDEKWWELVVAEDNKQLTPGPGAGTGGGASGGGGGLPGFGSGGGTPPPPGPSTTAPGAGARTNTPPTPPPPPPRTERPDLSRQYVHEATSVQWTVKAYEVAPSDPELDGGKRAWKAKTLPQGDTDFYFDPRHRVFRSATLTPFDALLAELAFRTADFLRGRANAPTFDAVLVDLRAKYGGRMDLDPAALATNAGSLFRSIAATLARNVADDDATRLFGELPSTEQEAIHHRMASRGITNPAAVVTQGRFLEHASPRIVLEFVRTHPDLFFDGRCWDEVYVDIDYQYPAATAEARARVLRQYEALLLDALWLAEQEPRDIVNATRERVLRAALAVEMLAPLDAEAEDAQA
ncbi:MAG: ATP-binding protein [Alphaproteobacteria bacterium]|nr:ATP-binding protein [Alphaproteobacteria bacterium]